MKNKIILFIILIILAFLIFQKISEKKGKAEKGESFLAYEGHLNIVSLLDGNLNGMGLEEISNFRKEKIKEYEVLKFYPQDYEPFKPPHNKIYGSITPYKDWLTAVPYYISNPYLLVILTCAGHVTPLNWYCRDTQIEYYSGKIVETRYGKSAQCWFEKVFSSPDYPGNVRVILVNADDSCFCYSNLDISNSINIEESNDPENIVNAIHKTNVYFHVGRYGVNNLSPENRKEWVKIKEKDKETKIIFKLWRIEPSSKEDSPDLTYEFHISP